MEIQVWEILGIIIENTGKHGIIRRLEPGKKSGQRQCLAEFMILMAMRSW